MGIKNKISEGYTYFVTFTIVDWVDVFIRRIYKDEIVESLKYCQKEKELGINSWVIMTNHMPLIANGKEGFLLSDILREFKKYTSK